MAVPGGGGADVGFPVGVDREESTGCGGHHSSAIQDSVGVVGRCVDVLHDGLGSGVVVCCGIAAGFVWFWVGWRWMNLWVRRGDVLFDVRWRCGWSAVVAVVTGSGYGAVLWI